VKFSQPTLAASNTSVTTTTAYNVLINGNVTQGTNQTITNNYALGVNGDTKMTGNLTVTGVTNIPNIISLAMTTVSNTSNGQTTTVTSSNLNYMYLVSNTTGNSVMQLPSASSVSAGFTVSFRKTDDLSQNAYGSQVQILPSSTSQTIGGFYYYLLTVRGEGLTIASDGTNWQIVNQVLSDKTTLTYTMAGTYYWTCPGHVTKVIASVWGAGGTTTVITNACAGSGGGFSEGTFTVVPGTTYTITVGLGSNTSGTSGGTSTITFGSSTISATGGDSLATNSNGGTGSGGALNYSGGSSGTGSSGASGAAGFSGNGYPVSGAYTIGGDGSGHYAKCDSTSHIGTSVRLSSFQREGGSGAGFINSDLTIILSPGFPGGAAGEAYPTLGKGADGAVILSY